MSSTLNEKTLIVCRNFKRAKNGGSFAINLGPELAEAMGDQEYKGISHKEPETGIITLRLIPIPELPMEAHETPAPLQPETAEAR